MTEAYDRFKKEVAAQGRERLDGFSLSWVDGLTDEERDQVRQELTVLLSTDRRVPEALYALDGQASLPLIAAELAATPMDDEDFRLTAAQVLLKATDDATYVHLLEDLLLHAKSKYVRNGAAGSLAKVLNVPTVDDVLFRALSSEKEQITRSFIASCLLERFGITYENKQTSHLRRAYGNTLARGTQAQREKAYAELQKYKKDK